MTRELDLTDDIIDIRDIIARVEALEDARGDLVSGPNGSAYVPGLDTDDATELSLLTDILADLAGNGGDEQWRGDWYPVTLVHDSYFTEYAQEMVEECSPDLPSWIEIDWEATAHDVRMDYNSVEIDGATYWYR